MTRLFNAVRLDLAATAACLLVAAWGNLVHAESTPASPGASAAPALVQAALDAELAGDAAGHDRLLAEALAADPNFAPARWHSGEVQFDGQWRTPDAVQNLVAHHPRWAGYRELRAARGDAPADHLELAIYCRDHNLDNEGRFHWSVVLLANPANRAAREYLGLREHHGALLTAEQVAALDRWEDAAAANLKQHRPRLTQLCRDATDADPTARAAALAEIRSITDPAILPVLEPVAAKACENAPPRAEDLHLAVVAALANIPEHEATLRLLNHAVYAESPRVRERAAAALRPRPQTDYVPLLMAALQAPIEVDTTLVAGQDGSVHATQTLWQAGPEVDFRHERSLDFTTSGSFLHDRRVENSARVLNAHMNRAANELSATLARVDRANQDAEWLNGRVEHALRVATERDHYQHPQQWWEQWQKHNELSYRREEFRTSEELSSEYRYVIRDPHAEIRPHSCFVPGTPVWTSRGPVPIETIAIGDHVLAQNPHTGELAYRAVLDTTIGTPTDVVNLAIGGETIGATLGHRFWVNGRGWTMAKELEPAAQLHALGAAADLRAMAKAEPAACHNLEVDEFHTFFVGESKILVHDRSCPQPVLAAVPGSATRRPPGQPDVASPIALAP